jgi:hypothetical protein
MVLGVPASDYVTDACVVLPLLLRCVPFLHGLAAITPNAQELLVIANTVQARHGLPPLQQPAAAVVSEQHSSATPQQLLAQIAPAAAVVLHQGVLGPDRAGMHVLHLL